MKLFMVILALLLLGSSVTFGQTPVLIKSFEVRTDFVVPWGLKANLAVGELYVLNHPDQTLTVYSMDGSVKKTIQLPLYPRSMDVSPSGIIAVAAWNPNPPARTPAVMFVDPQTGVVQPPVWVDDIGMTCDVSFASDTLLYTDNCAGGQDVGGARTVPNTAAIIKGLNGWAVDRTWITLPSNRGTNAIAASPNGKLYMVCYHTVLSGGFSSTEYDVRVFDPADNSTKVLDLGFNPLSLPEVLGNSANNLMYVSAAPKSGSQGLLGLDEVSSLASAKVGIQTGLMSFPSSNPCLAYIAWRTGGWMPIDVCDQEKVYNDGYLSSHIIDRFGVNNFTLASWRGPDGDTVVLFRNTSPVRVDVYKMPLAPQVSAIVNSASFKSGPISPNEYVSIFGNNLTSGKTSDGGEVPRTELEGTSVKICGKTARPEYVSLTQVNTVSPPDVNAGDLCDVEVTTPLGTAKMSTQVLIQDKTIAAFQFIPLWYGLPFPLFVPILVNSTGQLLGPPILSPMLAQPKRGQSVRSYVNGCGVRRPNDQNVPAAGIPMPVPPVVTLGGIGMKVNSAGLVGGSAAICVLELIVPQNLPAQDPQVPFQLCPEGGECYSFWVAAN